MPVSGNATIRSMRIFGFAGWSGSGKTTLIERLIPFVGNEPVFMLLTTRSSCPFRRSPILR